MSVDEIERWVDADGYVRPLWPAEVIRHHRVYFIRAGKDGPVKVGFSTDFQQRLRELQTASPHELKLEAAVMGTPAVEAWLHRERRRWHLRGEWFDLDHDRICYALGRLFEEGLTWL
jgi:hypothetical protein